MAERSRVQDRPAQRDLVLVRLKPDGTRTRQPVTGAAGSSGAVAITPLVAELDTYFNAPKWSPDGRTIAVERHRLGAMPEIVVIDAATAVVRVVAADSRTFVTPAWRLDGAAIVAAAASEEQTFNLVELALDGSPARQLTQTTGGRLPDVSPDGKTIVFATTHRTTTSSRSRISRRDSTGRRERAAPHANPAIVFEPTCQSGRHDSRAPGIPARDIEADVVDAGHRDRRRSGAGRRRTRWIDVLATARGGRRGWCRARGRAEAECGGARLAAHLRLRPLASDIPCDGVQRDVILRWPRKH
jgi:dipeptidyl aminopeptidase/acylaminoacyl peptidase